jgi:hypothetical protein
MDDFWLLIKMGFQHVWDWQGYDHLLFLAALCLPFAATQWKKLLVLVTVFTLGHSLSLILATYGVVRVNLTWIEFLIPFSILLTALYNIVWASKTKSNSTLIPMVVTLFFGIIHGFGFASYFDLIKDSDSPIGVSLLAFAIGIEFAQLLLALLVLVLNVLVIHLFKSSRRDWLMVGSSIIIGILLPILIDRLP